MIAMTTSRQPLKVGVGLGKDGSDAVLNALEDARNPTLAIVFATSKLNPHEVYESIRNEVDCPIIGCTTAGEIASCAGKEQTGKVAVMLLESKHLSVGVGVGKNYKENPFEAGVKAVEEAYRNVEFNPYLLFISAMRKSAYEIMSVKTFMNIVIPDGLVGAEEEMLRGIISKLGKSAHIIGGSSGDDLKFERTYQFANGVYTNSVVLCVLSGGLKMGTAIGHPYYPTDIGAAVTKSNGRIVYELDGEPAADRMKEILGVKELTPEVFAERPFGFRTIDVSKEYVVRGAVSEGENKSIPFYSEIPDGVYLKLMNTNREYAIKKFEETLDKAIADAGIKKNVGAIIIFNCALRRLAKERLGFSDLDIIREKFGDVPVIGFDTYGEQGATPGGSIAHHNQTSAILVIGNELITQ
jgi:hypothetical protein